ncbi:hypothetical protein CEK25_002363 [Fusarium fujikuroi]|nr:hypothetical protein CEK25_002363 [Fusarium fujikuroi]
MDSLSSSFTQAQSASVMPSATQDISGPVSEAWWKEASVYQIYPSSFKDSNGDGIGDIPGVIEKLDYFKNLGVDIVWLCPVYPSPQVDMGYDVADYCDIDPQYGTMADVERLIEGLHSRDLKLLMDLVVNHTSDKHKWFQESKSSKDSPYRDWYIWRKPRYDENGERQPPNNWLSYFGGTYSQTGTSFPVVNMRFSTGSAWEYDSASDEYYLHLFAKEQPDLNWEHAPVREAVHDIIRFWLGKGVDGFRMDVINFISKQDGLPDATVKIPGAKYQWGDEHYACGPRLHEYLQDIGKILKEYNAFSVGEMPAVQDPKEVIKSVGESRGELNMIFNFEIVDMDHGDGGKFSPRKWEMQDLKRIVNKWQTFMYKNKGWNALYLENHDQARTVSRWASDKPAYRALSAKMLSTFLCFQSGTVFVYQGQELGMANMPADWEMTEHRDLETLNHWEELKQTPGSDAAVLDIARKEYQLKSRDHARTPVQWDSSTNAGFSTATPWIRVNDDYKDVFEHFALLDEKNEDIINDDVFSMRGRWITLSLFVASETERFLGPLHSEFNQSGKTISLLANNPEVNLSQKISLRPFEAICLSKH